MSSHAGKYLTFHLGDETYGTPILKIQEILGLMPITRVPRAPPQIRGVINLRGKVIPVLDLRTVFEMEIIPDSERSCIVVVQIEQEGQRLVLGVLVDEVSEVADIGAEAIEPVPEFGARLDTRFLLGVGKVGEQVVLLLDLDRVLTHQQTGELAELGH